MGGLMRYLLTLLILLLASPAYPWGGSVATIGGGTPAAATSSCPAGTYVMAWDGDYTSDTDKACIGSTPTDGTISGATVGTDYGETGNGALLDAVDDYITYSLAAGDYSESGAYTFCMRARFVSDGTDTNTIIFEIEDDTDNVDQASIVITDDERVRISWRGNSTADTVQTAASAISKDSTTWYTIVGSWKPETAAGNDMAVSANGGSTWVEEDDDPVAFVAEMNGLSLGNYRIYQGAGPDPVHIDKWALVSGYKASCPW